MQDELVWMSADQLAGLYRQRAVSPVEVVDATLEQLAKVDPKVNAFVTVTAESARAQAKDAESAFMRGKTDLPALYGIPITVKDLTETAGVRTTYGSLRYADHVPDVDSLSWARLKSAGTILIGKTTTPEFGMLGVTESKLTGTTGNPWDPTRTSGGSSGGAAAACVAGVGPLAWGSDGGGSIRVPSSVCGAVGIKPTTGRIPLSGNTDPDSTDGPITRTVVDAALLLDATVGHHPEDRFSLPRFGEDFAGAARSEGDLSGLRIAANADLGQGPIDPETRRVFMAALDDMASAGAVIEQVDLSLPDVVEYFVRYWGPFYITLADEFAADGYELWPKAAWVAEQARQLTPVEVSRAMREVKTDLYNAYARVFQSFDLLVTPTTPLPAFPHAGDLGCLEVVDGVRLKNPGFFFHRLTEPPAHAGLPALSVPCGFTKDLLPVGLQIIGPLFADLAVIRAAAAYERATAWTAHHPPLAL